MTYAPPTLTALARYYVSHGGRNLGIVGDTRHQVKGRSYHLGKSQLTPDAYSRKTARDRAGLSEAASAFDFGAINGSYVELRKFSKWLVKRCQTNAPGTQDIREVIYSPDGVQVLRWDRERGVNSAPRSGEADASHRGHTHVSWYRDSEKRPKVGAIRPYFEPAKPATPPATPAKEEPVSTDPVIKLADAAITRLGYFKNKYEAGDKEVALTHLAMEQSFTGRILVSIVGSTVDVNDPDEPLSADRNVAIHQLLAATGHPTVLDDSGASIASDPAAVAADATPDQLEALTVLGYFGQPGTRPGIDYAPFERYYENTASTGLDAGGQPIGGGWTLKSEYPTGDAVWAAYLASKG